MSSTIRLNEIGPSCPRCGKPTKVCAHRTITSKQLKQPFFYSKWYKCTNELCKTTLIMPEEFRVFNQALTPPTPKTPLDTEPNFKVVYDQDGNPRTIGRDYPRDQLPTWVLKALDQK